MLSTWNPNYKVFSFNDVDTTPMVEEYQMLLEIPYVAQNRIYLHLNHKQTCKWFAHIIGVPAEEAKVKETVKGNSHGWPWIYIKKHLDQHI